jgi:hypothetical protein
VALSLGGATFGIFGAAGPCTFANFGDYQTALTDSGEAVIQGVSDSVFGNVGADFDAIVRAPLTALVQAMWANFVDTRIQDDLPNNPIIKR